MIIGVISNERSHGNRKGAGAAAGLADGPQLRIARIRRSDPAGLIKLAEVLAEFAAQNVELIVVDGGDGTVRDILSRIDTAYGQNWPMIALLPSGKTNAIAADVGHSGQSEAGLRRLLAARQAGSLGQMVTMRPALEVTGAAGQGRMRGFLFGYGAFSEGVRFANEKIHPAGVNKGLAVVLSAAGAIKRGFAARKKTPEMAGTAAHLSVDGQTLGAPRSFVMLASTLDRLTPGIKPFWSDGRGDVNWLNVAAPVQRPVIGLGRMVMGRPKDWMRGCGYHSGRASAVEVRLDDDFVLDGELFPPDGHVRLAPSQPIRFVRAQ